MIDKNECSECGTFNTERVHVEWYADMIEEVRICNKCLIQYTNRYNLFEQETDNYEP